MSIVQPSSGDVPEVPNSLYLATITKVQDVSLDKPDQFGKTEKVDITVEFEVDGEIVTLDPRVNRSWSEKATLFTIAMACGIDANPYEPFDTEALLRRQVNILTEQEEGKWPRVKSWSRVTQRRGKATTPAAPPKSTECLEHDPVYKPDGTMVCLNCGIALEIDPDEIPFEP